MEDGCEGTMAADALVDDQCGLGITFLLLRGAIHELLAKMKSMNIRRQPEFAMKDPVTGIGSTASPTSEEPQATASCGANGRLRLPAKRLVVVCVLALALCWTGRALAGLYNPCELEGGPFDPEFLKYRLPDGKSFREGEGFVQVLSKYRAFGLPLDKAVSPMHSRYVLVGDALAGAKSPLSPDQKIGLSEYLMRRGHPLEAKVLLTPLTREKTDNFLLFSNLATACCLAAEGKQAGERHSEYQQAAEHLADALKRWPEFWEDMPEAQRKYLEGLYWTQDTFIRCRSAEVYFLKLLKNRQREAREAMRGAKVPDAVDPLFHEGQDSAKAIQYVGDSGRFEPGKLAKTELAKLPEKNIDNALAIVQHLLIWLPNDNRLYWQLGELYNARGAPRDLRAAQKIFDELVYDRQVSFRDALKSQRNELNNLQIPADDSGPTLPPHILNDIKDIPEPAIDWRTLGIGFGAGLVVAMFAGWQIQEIRRRRTAASRVP